MNQDTKKTILIIVWSLAALVLAAGTAWWWINYGGFSLYQDNQYKFALKYPTKWTKLPQFKGTAVTFLRPKETALDVFQPNVNIGVQEVPEHIATLTSFSETITKQMIAVFDKNITILEDKDFKFANRLGHRLIIDAPNPDKLKVMFIWTIKGSFAYIFTFAAREDQYKEIFPTIEKMVDSFELK